MKWAKKKETPKHVKFWRRNNVFWHLDFISIENVMKVLCICFWNTVFESVAVDTEKTLQLFCEQLTVYLLFLLFRKPLLRRKATYYSGVRYIIAV